MWGNTLGWSISALLLVLVASALWLLNRANALSPSTSFARDAQRLGVVQLPVAPATVVPTPISNDAASVYRPAVADYLANADDYERFAQRGAVGDVTKLKALDLLVQGTPMSRMQFFESDPGKVVNYSPQKPELDALIALGKIAERAGSLCAAAKPPDLDGAGKYFSAEFSLGSKLFNERVTAEELMAGLTMMGDAAAGLQRVATKQNDAARTQSITSFDAARRQFQQEQIQPMLNVLSALGGRTVYEHAGDIFYLAEHAPDRVWRVESILALGRMRYDIGGDEGSNGRVADQRGAMRALRRYSQDSDSVIRTAAIAARDLTMEDYRRLGTR